MEMRRDCLGEFLLVEVERVLIRWCRISGRPSHVSRLRAEFDAGADYELSEIQPGDLDPHAVSSLFKAYLREREWNCFLNASDTDIFCSPRPNLDSHSQTSIRPCNDDTRQHLQRFL